jgi:hypothetical protein
MTHDIKKYLQEAVWFTFELPRNCSNIRSTTLAPNPIANVEVVSASHSIILLCVSIIERDALKKVPNPQA